MERNSMSLIRTAASAGAICAAAGLATGASAQDCVWGSFDSTRINYSSGTLNGDAHITLRDIIADNGGTVAAGTSTLTANYLSDKDVFYTSLLNRSTGELSSDEQTALHNWVASGGTLIVTADYGIPANVWDSVTAYYGVTNFQDLIHQGYGTPVASHPITDNVSSYRYAAECTYTYGADAMLLGDNGMGDDFMVVLEPDSGFNDGGRILVLGDHNMFTESFISEVDNIQLANNIAAWACSAGPCLEMTLSNFAAGQTARWDITGGVEGKRVAVVYGFQEGSTVINGFGGYCASFGIKGVNQSRLIGTAVTSGGTATVRKRIPGGTAGTRVLTQAAQQGTCPGECMSNLVDEVIG